MNKKFYFIVNPIAGPFNNIRYCEQIKKELLLERIMRLTLYPLRTKIMRLTWQKKKQTIQTH